MGGKYGKGGVWKYDVNLSKYSKVADFGNTTNSIVFTPTSPLILGDGGHLYGVAKSSGVDDDGHLYKIDTTTDSLEYVASLAVAGWAISDPSSQITYNSSLNKIFGTKEVFSGSNFGGGVYSYDITNKVVTNEASILIGEVDVLGSNASGMAPIANDGNHYFVTHNGAAHGKGALVRFSPSSGTMVKVHDFLEEPSRMGMVISGTKIYGSYFTLSPDKPMIWAYDVGTGFFSEVLSSTDDNSPGSFLSSSFIVNNGHIIGRTAWGGEGNSGSLFKYNSLTSTFTHAQANTSSEGRGLMGEIVFTSDSKALVYTAAGGPFDSSNVTTLREHGGIAEVDLFAGQVSPEKTISSTFQTEERYHKFGLRPTITSGGNLLVASTHRTSGGSISTMRKINMTTGANEYIGIFDSKYRSTSVLELSSDQYIFGIKDTLYVYEESTGNLDAYYTQLLEEHGYMGHNFTKASDGKIYGTTISSDYDDAAQRAVIFSLDTNTWEATVEHTFEAEINQTNIGLTEVNGKLYGSTYSGGSNGDGYLFSFDLATQALIQEHSYNTVTDGDGFGGQFTNFNDTLYGLSYAGGTNEYGTLVSFVPSTSEFTVIEHLTLNNGLANKATPAIWNEPYAPVITSSDSVTATEQSLFTYAVTATDANPSDSISFSLENAPTWLSLTGSEVSGTPQFEQADTSFVVIASDGTLSDTLKVYIQITDINQLPYLTSDTIVISGEQNLGVPLVDVPVTDGDGDMVQIEVLTFKADFGIYEDSLVIKQALDSVDVSYSLEIELDDGVDKVIDTLVVLIESSVRGVFPQISNLPPGSMFDNSTLWVESEGPVLIYDLSGHLYVQSNGRSWIDLSQISNTKIIIIHSNGKSTLISKTVEGLQ